MIPDLNMVENYHLSHGCQGDREISDPRKPVSPEAHLYYLRPGNYFYAV